MQLIALKKIGQGRDFQALRKIALVMRLTTIILFAACIQVSASAYSQKVSITGNNISLKKVFREIKKQTGYSFIYAREDISKASPLTIDVKDANLEAVLKKCFAHEPLTFLIKNNIIIVRSRPVPASPKGLPEKEIKGQVRDSATGQPLAGVTIRVKGTTMGAVTDENGQFSLEVSDGAVLEVSFLGYRTKVIQASGNEHLNVSLSAAATGLDQLVVVGYGTQKKKNLTGAVTQIDAKMLKDRPIGNVGKALQGVVPNLNINFSSGRPGAVGKLNIRGFTSVNGGKPLVLIDGVPGEINLINPSDIATITVLKDASSAAIYGARAAYGVVLITTKKGTPGKLRVTYRSNFAVSTPTTSHSFMTDGAKQVKLVDSAWKISTGSRFFGYNEEDYKQMKMRLTDHSLPAVEVQNRNGKEQYIYYGNFDWWNYFFRNSLPSMSHSLEFSGGSQDVTFMISGRYYQQKGMLNFSGDKFTDYDLRAKVNAHINRWLTIDNNLHFVANVYNWPGPTGVDNLFSQLQSGFFPNYVPQNPDGTFVYRSDLNLGTLGGVYLEMASGNSTSQEKGFDLINTFSFTITPFQDLTLKASYSYDLNPYSSFHRSVVNTWSVFPGVLSEINNDNYSESLNLDQYHVVNAHATYQKSFGNNAIKVMAGYNQEFKKYHILYGSGNDLLSPDLNALDLATSGQTVGSNSANWALLGFFGRINYNYNDKYLLELDGRYDGSSHFPANSRFGFFPSISAGWRMSEEPFFDGIDGVISSLKLRGSVGALGNQSLSTNLRNNNYPYIPLMNTGLSTWLKNGAKSEYLALGSPVSAQLTWERTVSKDIGLDVGAFDNRLSVTFDWYDRKTLDMLLPGATLPAVFGASSPRQNAGNLDTKGWELSVKWRNSLQLLGKTLTYSAGFVLSNFRSHITKFNNPSQTLIDHYKGERIGDIWGYTVDGYFQSDAEAKNYSVNQDFVNRQRLKSPGEANKLQAGDMKFVDLNGDGVVDNGSNTLTDHGDLKIIGNSLPQLPFGITGSLDWNNFNLSFFFQGVGKQDWYPGKETWLLWGPYGRAYYSFFPKNFESKMWSPDNPNAYFPRLRSSAALTSSSELSVANTKYIQNAAYVRLKNLTIGYSLPAHILKAWKVEQIRFYVSGENIFTVSGLDTKYIDPEQVSSDPNGTAANVSARNYPFMKSFSAGFDIVF